MDCPLERIAPNDYEERMKPRGDESSTSAVVVDKFNTKNTNNNNGLWYLILYAVRYCNIMYTTASMKYFKII